MPKVSTDTTDAPKKAPRKRAVRRTIGADETPVRRTRAAAPRVTEEAPAPVRKAPTRLAEYSEEPKSSKKWPKVLALFVVVVGGAAWIGFSDKGQIDVNTRINEANQNIATEAAANGEAGASTETVVPVQNTPPAAISGIVPRAEGDMPPAPEPTPAPTEEASSTDAVEGEATTEENTEAESTEGTPAETPTEEAAPVEEGTPEPAP